MKTRRFFILVLILAVIGISAWYYKSFKTVPALPAYEVNLINEQGLPVKLADFKGKYLLISYFQTWCPSCIKELTDIEMLQKKLGAEKLNVLLVTDEDPAKINHFKENYSVKLDFYRTEKSLAEQRIRVFPTTYLLDKNGNIIMSKLEAFDWSKNEVVNKCSN